MDESKPDRSSDKGVETPILLKTMAHNEKHQTHMRETHGSHDDIDAKVPITDVKGPNVFERVKEEFEAIVEAVHHRKEDNNQDSPSSVKRDDATFTGSKHEKQSSLSDHRGTPSPRHHKETHGRGEDIDADIPIDEFKGPSILHRVKEEIEAIADTIHSKKESDHVAASSKKYGF